MSSSDEEEEKVAPLRPKRGEAAAGPGPGPGVGVGVGPGQGLSREPSQFASFSPGTGSGSAAAAAAQVAAEVADGGGGGGDAGKKDEKAAYRRGASDAKVGAVAVSPGAVAVSPKGAEAAGSGGKGLGGGSAGILDEKASYRRSSRGSIVRGTSSSGTADGGSGSGLDEKAAFRRSVAVPVNAARGAFRQSISQRPGNSRPGAYAASRDEKGLSSSDVGAPSMGSKMNEVTASHLTEQAREDAGGLQREPSNYASFAQDGGDGEEGAAAGAARSAISPSAGIAGRGANVRVHAARESLRPGGGSSPGSGEKARLRTSRGSIVAAQQRPGARAQRASITEGMTTTASPVDGGRRRRSTTAEMFRSKLRQGGGSGAAIGSASSSAAATSTGRRGSDGTGARGSIAKRRHHRYSIREEETGAAHPPPPPIASPAEASSSGRSNVSIGPAIGSPGAYAVDEMNNEIEARTPTATTSRKMAMEESFNDNRVGSNDEEGNPSSPSAEGGVRFVEEESAPADRRGGPSVMPSRRDLAQPPDAADSDDFSDAGGGGVKGFLGRYSTRCKVIVAAALLAAVAVAVAVPIALSSGGGGNGGGAGGNSAAANLGVDLQDEQAAQKRMDDLRIALIDGVPSTSATDLDKPGTPQRDALRWLAYNDKFDSATSGMNKLAERYSLAVLFYSTGGETEEDRGGGGGSWITSEGWLEPESDVCTWFGVGCEGGPGSDVISIDLKQNGLKGTIPTEVGVLSSSLKELILSKNKITGALPTQLFDLVLLEKLQVADNQIEGEISPLVGKLTSLRKLDLYENLLKGELPEEIGNLKDLSILDVSRNEIKGQVPASLLSLVDIEELGLCPNEFKGNLLDYSSMPKLIFLALDDCSFDGPIPKGIGTLSNLERLYLSKNKLEDAIPEELGGATSLVELYLDFNRLTGRIPDSMANLSNLESFDASRNNLKGSVPTGMCDFEFLTTFVMDCTVNCNCCSLCT